MCGNKKLTANSGACINNRSYLNCTDGELTTYDCWCDSNSILAYKGACSSNTV